MVSIVFELVEYGVDILDVGIDYTDRSKPKSLTDIRYYQITELLAMRLESMYLKYPISSSSGKILLQLSNLLLKCLQLSCRHSKNQSCKCSNSAII